MKLHIFWFMLFFIGCATTSSTGVYIDVSVKDDIENRRFVINFTNEGKIQLCLSPGMWPNSAGKLDYASDRVYILVKDKVFPLLDFNTGYCPGCALRVQSGDSIEGYISYTDFNLPIEYYQSEKKMTFSPVANACKK